MVQELLPIVAIMAAVFGAIASTIQGYWRQDKPYSGKKLTSAILSSAFFAFGIVNLSSLTDALTTLGWVGVIVTNLILGYGIDQVHSSLDK